ncbi:Dynein beta chain, ciliary, partial [Eumeta japonica]
MDQASTSAEAAAAAGNGPDPRLELMGSFVIKSLKLKPEKWARVITVEEHKGIIKEFLDRSTPVVLIIILTQAAQLVPTTTFPLTQLKSKGVFFIKKHPLPIPKEECNNPYYMRRLATRTI